MQQWVWEWEEADLRANADILFWSTPLVWSVIDSQDTHLIIQINRILIHECAVHSSSFLKPWSDGIQLRKGRRRGWGKKKQPNPGVHVEDISQGMVDQYNKRAETLGITSKMSAIAYELNGLPEELEGCKFNVVLVRTSTWAPKLPFRTDMYSQCTMTYHHFEVWIHWRDHPHPRVLPQTWRYPLGHWPSELGYCAKNRGKSTKLSFLTSRASPRRIWGRCLMALYWSRSHWMLFLGPPWTACSAWQTRNCSWLKVLSRFSNERESSSLGFHCCLLSPGVWYRALQLMPLYDCCTVVTASLS